MGRFATPPADDRGDGAPSERRVSSVSAEALVCVRRALLTLSQLPRSDDLELVRLIDLARRRLVALAVLLQPSGADREHIEQAELERLRGHVEPSFPGTFPPPPTRMVHEAMAALGEAWAVLASRSDAACDEVIGAAATVSHAARLLEAGVIR